jgi:hypothetical protein
MSDELSVLLKEAFEYNMTNVHTAFPGAIEKYDAKTRRADIQPYLKRKLPDGKFMNFPVVPDVPVLFFGTTKFSIHAPLEKGDEVLVIVCERSTDNWRDEGGTGIEDDDPRRFNLMDCFAIPGLQPVEFIVADEDGLQIIHKDKPDGELISQVLMTDDKVEAVFKKKAAFSLEEDHVTAKNEKCLIEMKPDELTAKNSKVTVKLKGTKASVNNGSKSLYTIMHNYFQAWQTNKPATTGSPATHFLNPAIETAIATADTDLGLLLEA